jgi:AAA-like domain
LWNHLNLLIGHSTEPALFIDDINQSPFKVGEVFRLRDFSVREVEKLNEAYGWPLRTSAEIEQLMHLVGGQPYLVMQLLYSLRTEFDSFEGLKQVAAADDGPFGDHLRRQLWMLRGREQLRQALKQVIRHDGCAELDFQRLRAAGLVEGNERWN